MHRKVTAQDVARLYLGEITDEDECERILEATWADPGLGRDYRLLFNPEIESEARPAPELEWLKSHGAALESARLCPLRFHTKDGTAESASAGAGDGRIRATAGLAQDESLEVDFRESAEGEWQCIVPDVPGLVEVLDITSLDVAFASAPLTDITVRRADREWNKRRLATRRSPASHPEYARLLCGPKTQPTLETDGAIDLSLQQAPAGKMFVQFRDRSETRPVPVIVDLHSGVTTYRQVLVLNDHEKGELVPLLPESDEDIEAVTVRQLAMSELPLLTSAEKSELLAGVRPIAAAMDKSPDGAYAFRMRREWFERLASGNLSAFLTIRFDAVVNVEGGAV